MALRFQLSLYLRERALLPPHRQDEMVVGRWAATGRWIDNLGRRVGTVRVKRHTPVLLPLINVGGGGVMTSALYVGRGVMGVGVFPDQQERFG